MPIWTAILIASAATSLMNFGLALQKRGAAGLPKIGEQEGLVVFRAFVTEKIWMAGLVFMTGGWGLYLVSANYAPISIVQPTLGVGLAVLALFSVFYLHEHIRPLEWTGFAAMLCGIFLLGASAVEEGPGPPPGWPAMLFVTGAVAALAALAWVLSKRGMLGAVRTDSLLGMVGGLFIGLGAIYTKAMFNFIEGKEAVTGLAICLPVVIGANIVGLTVMQSGFQHGKALVVVVLEAVVNKVVAIIGAMAALEEYLPDDPVKAGMRLSAFALILFGTGVLSRFGGKEVADLMAESDQGGQS